MMTAMMEWKSRPWLVPIFDSRGCDCKQAFTSRLGCRLVWSGWVILIDPVSGAVTVTMCMQGTREDEEELPVVCNHRFNAVFECANAS